MERLKKEEELKEMKRKILKEQTRLKFIEQEKSIIIIFIFSDHIVYRKRKN
jgi:hypothetical protein